MTMISKEGTIIKTATFSPSTSLCLIGFMGSGKSTLATKLGALFNLCVFSTDTIIQNKLQQSIPEIFQTQGEVFFRLQEKILYEELCRDHQKKIIDCGGGFGLDLDLTKLGKVIFLDTPLSVILQRMDKQEREKRPLFTHQIETLYKYRRKIYLQKAQIFYQEKEGIEGLCEKLKRV